VKVILIENVDRLGNIGDVVTVKAGYARNFLLPQKLAKEASESNVKFLEALKKKRVLEEKKKLDLATVLAEKIAALDISIAAEAGEEDKLFGSVSSEMISEALAANGISIDKKDIILDEPIKKLGVFTVKARIHPEVKATLKISVIKKEIQPSA
jgi:large subunit ribosomal protein L9